MMSKIPKALFEVDEINYDRGRYIVKYISSNNGKEMPQELLNKYGYFTIPQNIIVEAKKGNLFLADLTFLFACYYVASQIKRKSIRMDEVFECITRNWNETRTNNALESLNLKLTNLERYRRWIKKYEHNNKYYLKY